MEKQSAASPSLRAVVDGRQPVNPDRRALLGRLAKAAAVPAVVAAVSGTPRAASAY